MSNNFYGEEITSWIEKNKDFVEKESVPEICGALFDQVVSKHYHDSDPVKARYYPCFALALSYLKKHKLTIFVVESNLADRHLELVIFPRVQPYSQHGEAFFLLEIIVNTKAFSSTNEVIRKVKDYIEAKEFLPYSLIDSLQFEVLYV